MKIAFVGYEVQEKYSVGTSTDEDALLLDFLADHFAGNTMYARVDGILKGNTFLLMELELIEPYLFLDNEPARMENYYKALQQWM